MSKVTLWLKNASTAHQRVFARFLRNRGWVAFYLDDSARKCNDMCWLHLYEQEMQASERG